MNVAELIAELRKCNPSDPVMLIVRGESGWLELVESDENSRTVDLHAS